MAGVTKVELVVLLVLNDGVDQVLPPLAVVRFDFAERPEMVIILDDLQVLDQLVELEQVVLLILVDTHYDWRVNTDLHVIQGLGLRLAV